MYYERAIEAVVCLASGLIPIDRKLVYSCVVHIEGKPLVLGGIPDAPKAEGVCLLSGADYLCVRYGKNVSFFPYSLIPTFRIAWWPLSPLV